ncbi:KilA-N domain-containing protein [Bacteroides timonensis]|uniref:KilA-N domain-containing protein n=1 Tax=Bacteroides timonensis TaxID=1470345 RepID=UPI0004AC9BA7|nr:KilA-N domain-containing protein [Bacteroides timonensis]
METKEFEYNGKVVGFEIDDKNVMVNATQMANVFNRDLYQFTKSEDTKRFIETCLKPANAGLLEIVNRTDLIVSRQKAGTFMHRVLAIKFAAWLNPDFELWVYTTIDKILFGSYLDDEKSLKEIARIQTQISQKEQYLVDHPIQKEIEELKKAEQKERRLLDLRKKERISNFKSMFSVGEMAGESEKATEE